MLQHTFSDPLLLVEALTTRSYRCEHPGSGGDNQRLEFLGDAVLELVSSRALFDRFPDAQEGALTVMRSRLSDETALAAVARRIGLGAQLRLGRGEEQQGVRERDSVLSDALEALLGAVFLDGGFDAASAAFARTFAPELDALADFDAAAPSRWEGNPKGRLQQWVASRLHEDPVYKLLGREGPDHAPVFRVEVLVGGEVHATGAGPSRQKAEAAAAAAALEALEAHGDEQGKPTQPD